MPEVTARDALAVRQRAVLDALLTGGTPPGFDRRGTALTTRVLHSKRSAAALRVVPELRLLPDWRAHFHAWAATHPARGCSHDDARAFVQAVAGSIDAGWLRLHEVYDGRRRVMLGRVGGRWTAALGWRSTVWQLGPTPTKGG